MARELDLDTLDIAEAARLLPHARHEDRQRQLEWLLREDNIEWEKVRELMFVPKLDPNIRLDINAGIHPTHLAAYAGEVEFLNWCITNGADVCARSTVGRSVLHYACDGNRSRCIRLLLDKEADVNVRTLAGLTPLHLACKNNSYDAVMLLLDQTEQIVDIDAEDTRRRIPEAMTTDKKIQRLVRKYRYTLDDKKKAELINAAITRLFKLFDINGDGYIYPEEWAETMSFLAMHFENHCESGIEEAFAQADRNKDGKVDLKEFKMAHEQLFESLGLPYKEIMNGLCDIENMVFQEKVRLQRCTPKHAPFKDLTMRPVVSERAKAIKLDRTHSVQTMTIPRAITPRGSAMEVDGHVAAETILHGLVPTARTPTTADTTPQTADGDASPAMESEKVEETVKRPSKTSSTLEEEAMPDPAG
eukprot:TRINITY_DN17985_c0_g1_i1.p1 TRINITY_DN17985_c0_g1~~TRINITY_DN17985_c0_g1_i1.p1  ORF type:complete len:418 (-),score=90.58 TRINITY_DN17985_c0_g1_i1:586-1839(-)